MKDQTQEMLESSRPQQGDLHVIEFCLSKLYADKKHNVEDEVVKGLTFEELIGALLIGKDHVRLQETIIELQQTVSDLQDL